MDEDEHDDEEGAPLATRGRGSGDGAPRRGRGANSAPIPRPVSPSSSAADGTTRPAEGFAAGVIFGCTNSTFDECFALSMVGLPRKYMPLVESIVARRTLIFIFNFSDRQLHGCFIATSDGQARGPHPPRGAHAHSTPS